MNNRRAAVTHSAFSMAAVMTAVWFQGCASDQLTRELEIREGKRSVSVTLRLDSTAETCLMAHSFRDGSLVDSSRWPLPYPIYRLEAGDIDGNETDDIAVGVVKATRYDSIVRKRIFIFQLQDGNIIPLWLGSRVSQPLHDFRLHGCGERHNVRTIEVEQDGSFLVAEYEWYGFGLSFVRYLARHATLSQARGLLNGAA